MSDKEITVTYEVDDTEVTLTKDIVYRFLTGGRRDIPEAEIVKFIMLCKARKLNPFTGDVYLTAYDTKNGVVASIITGKETFTKRAYRHPRYRGHEAGVVVISSDGTKLIQRAGSLVVQGEQLVGGWAKVHIEGFSVPIEEQVSLHEYDTQRSLWRTHKATMIRKVALVHALREAFPDEFAGMYTSEEMGEKGDNARSIIEDDVQTIDVVEQDSTHESF